MWLWALPLCLAVGGAAGFWAVLGISLANGSANLTNGLPLISVCANINPQSCVFAQTCNICCVLALWIVVTRFQQVRDYGDHGTENTVSVVCGIIASIGISVTGNFQSVHFAVLHFLGGAATFFFGIIYFWTQLYLTYQAQPSQDRYWVGPARAICCILGTFFFIGMSALLLSPYQHEAAVCEWGLTMMFFCMFGLFFGEFRHIDCYCLTVQKQALKRSQLSHPIKNKAVVQEQVKVFKRNASRATRGS